MSMFLLSENLGRITLTAFVVIAAMAAFSIARLRLFSRFARPSIWFGRRMYIDTSLLLYGSSRIWLSRVGMLPCLSEGGMQVMCILHAWIVWLFEVWNAPFDDIPKGLTHLSLKVIAFTSTSLVPGTRGYCSRLVIGGFVLDATQLLMVAVEPEESPCMLRFWAGAR